MGLFRAKSVGSALASGLALLTCACATSKGQGESGVDRAVSKTQSGFSDAALQPFSDVNLKQAPIPPKLEAIGSPYEPVANMSCTKLGQEIDELSTVLGPDYDGFSAEDTINQKAGDAAGGFALKTVGDVATGWIPYRSVIRAASGASAHEQRLKAAYEKGSHRRTYLKGMGQALGCGPPAAPDPRALLPKEKAPIEYRK